MGKPERDAYRAAKDALSELSRRERKQGIRHETPEYGEANDRVEEVSRRLTAVEQFMVGDF